MIIVEKRIKVGGGGVKVDRVIGGKIQRRKLRSSRKGFKVSGNKIIRMNPAEKRKRSLASRRGARKRKAKLSSILRKRKISIRRGKRSGLYK